MYTRSFKSVLVLLLVACVGSALPVWSQSASSGTVSGSVTGPSNAVVAGAAITLTDTSTNISRTANSRVPDHSKITVASFAAWAHAATSPHTLTAVISVQFLSVATAAIVIGPPLSAESFGAIELSSCKLSGVPQPARCGVLEVPENPNRPAVRQLRISVAVIPAISGHPRPDPIAVLIGGPGENAISSAEIYARNFAPLKRKQGTKTRLRPLGREELGCGGA